MVKLVLFTCSISFSFCIYIGTFFQGNCITLHICETIKQYRIWNLWPSLMGSKKNNSSLGIYAYALWLEGMPLCPDSISVGQMHATQVKFIAVTYRSVDDSKSAEKPNPIWVTNGSGNVHPWNFKSNSQGALPQNSLYCFYMFLATGLWR